MCRLIGQVNFIINIQHGHIVVNLSKDVFYRLNLLVQAVNMDRVPKGRQMRPVYLKEEIMQHSTRKVLSLSIPVLPLRGMMVFPHMVLHFDVGRVKSVAALEKAMMADQKIFLVAQKDADAEDPTKADLAPVGTIATIKQVLNLPGVTVTVRDMVDVLGRIAGEPATRLIRWEPDPAIQRIIHTWPTRWDMSRAHMLGFKGDQDFESIVRAFIKDDLVG